MIWKRVPATPFSLDPSIEVAEDTLVDVLVTVEESGQDEDNYLDMLGQVDEPGTVIRFFISSGTNLSSSPSLINCLVTIIYSHIKFPI